MAEAQPKSIREDYGYSTNERVSVLENQVVNISNTVERLEGRVEDQYKTLHHRISELRDDVREDIDSKHEKLIDKLDEHNETSQQHWDSVNSKITQLEKWKWMVMGGALVLGYFLAHIRIESLFG